jgi:hypothetical protein
MTCTAPNCEEMPVAACAKKFHCDHHKSLHTIQVKKEEAKAAKAAGKSDTPQPRRCAGMGPGRGHFTTSLAEAMDNRKEKAVIGNAVRFSKPIPSQPSNSLSNPHPIIPKAVNLSKDISTG